MSGKLLVTLVVALICVDLALCQTCTSSSGSTSASCVLPCIIFDHAPNYMNHSAYPSTYWNVKVFYDNPSLGNCGNAIGGAGWNNTDFELPLYILSNIPAPNYTALIINGETGLVGTLCSTANSFANCATIGTDRTPVYTYPGRSPLGQVNSPASFETFFHAVPATIPVPYNMSFVRTNSVPALYTFFHETFFPLDGIGWNDQGYAAPGEPHNFAFCMVLNTRFTYQGGESFYFSGDDDVYAYLNNLLVIDLGGVHTAQNASFLLNSIPSLTLGTTYRFDFFYCERHTITSEISISTTIEFFCAYSDWCGICEGNGQSCCSAGLCNDNNLCTNDSCGVTEPPPGGCVFTNVTCPATNNLCQTSACNPSTGQCVVSNVTCPGGTACQTAYCEPTAGCLLTPVLSCNLPGVQCLNGTCNAATGCVYKDVTCPVPNACFIPSCSNSSGCLTSAVPCAPNNACVSAACDTANGVCVQTPNPPCNDNNPCTEDICDAVLGCQYPLIPCPAGNPCVSYYCDKSASTFTCSANVTVCNDNNPCTYNNCSTTSGCIFPPIECDGTNSCYNVSCQNGACVTVSTAARCNDNSNCTYDYCYNNSGCSNVLDTCDDGLPCTLSSCNAKTGCQYANITDCENCGGVACNTTNPCFPMICNTTLLQCQTVPVVCSLDNNMCTNNTCVPVNGLATCPNTPLPPCPTLDVCNPAHCDPVLGCVTTPYPCPSIGLCNNVSCANVGGVATCEYPPVLCPYTDLCAPLECLAGQCVPAPNPPVCSDGNPCTIDTCVNTTGNCSFTPACPSKGNACNPITCINGQCITNTSNVCDTGNLCSPGTCVPTSTGYTCTLNPVNCTTDVCNPEQCSLATGLCVASALPQPCSAVSPCTIATPYCDPVSGWACNYTDVSATLCGDSDACTNDYCNYTDTSALGEEACYSTNVTCTSPDICHFVNGCSATNGCQIAPLPCPTPLSWCNVSSCDNIAGCIYTARACIVADNYCYQGICDAAAETCDKVQRPNWATLTNAQGVTCLLAYNTAAKVGLAAGTVAGIVIGAVVGAALIAVAAKKGVDVFMASRAGPVGSAINNPLYHETPNKGNNPLFA